MASVDWPKLGVYVVCIGMVSAAYLIFNQPPRPAPPVVVVQPNPPAVIPNIVPPPVVKPVVVPPLVVKPAPVAKPAPKPAPKSEPVAKPKPKFVSQRPVNKSPGCKQVPAEAYAHPLDVVLAASIRMGVTSGQMEVVKKCWRGESVS